MMLRALVALFLVIPVAGILASCQNLPMLPPSVTSMPSPPPVPSEIKPVPLPAQAPVSVPIPIAAQTPVNELVPSVVRNVLPTLSSMSVDLRNIEMPVVTAVFRFDTNSQPGYYSFSLLADDDSFEERRLDHYREGAPAIEVVWGVPPGRPAYYKLRNNEPVSDIFRTRVAHTKFTSVMTVPRNMPNDLETQIVDFINQDRRMRGLSPLTWDEGLLKDALSRLNEFGEEGAILPPRAGQFTLETAYMSGTSVIQDATQIVGSWIIDPSYFAVLTNPAVKSLVIRSDSYDNGRFYAVGLFRY